MSLEDYCEHMQYANSMWILKVEGQMPHTELMRLASLKKIALKVCVGIFIWEWRGVILCRRMLFLKEVKGYL